MDKLKSGNSESWFLKKLLEYWKNTGIENFRTKFSNIKNFRNPLISVSTDFTWIFIDSILRSSILLNDHDQ